MAHFYKKRREGKKEGGWDGRVKRGKEKKKTEKEICTWVGEYRS